MRWVPILSAAVATAACGGKAVRDNARAAEAANDRGRALEQRAGDERRPIERERQYQRARAAFDESCERGFSEGCDNRDRLDTFLVEELGVCDSTQQCRSQAIRWLPESRGQQRLEALCAGTRLDPRRGDRLWAPDAPACTALAEHLSPTAPDRAERAFARGCTALANADACRAWGAHHTGRGEHARARVVLSDACTRGDAIACEQLAATHQQLHRQAFRDDDAIRFRPEGVDPLEHLTAARDAAARGCDAGHAPACERRDAVVAQLHQVEQLEQTRGCLFHNTCKRGEFCNRLNGECEGPKNKGAFYATFADATAKYDAGDYAGARDAFERARAMNSDIPGPWRWLAYLNAMDQRYRECAVAANEAVRLRPKGKHAKELRALADKCAAAP